MSLYCVDVSNNYNYMCDNPKTLEEKGGPTIDKKSGKTMAPLWPHAMLSPSIVKYMLKART